jgi:hypothetical protein
VRPGGVGEMMSTVTPRWFEKRSGIGFAVLSSYRTSRVPHGAPSGAAYGFQCFRLKNAW